MSKQIESVAEETASLPLVIKERDVRYQFKRTVLYRRLLQGYPYTRPNIWKEARIDSLPLYRSYIWAALLGKYFYTKILEIFLFGKGICVFQN